MEARQLAKLIYISDPNGLTLEELITDPKLSHIPLSVLSDWAQEDSWNSERAKLWREIESKVKQQFTKGLVRAHSEALGHLGAVYQMLLARLTGEQNPDGTWTLPPPVRSFETGAKTLIELQKAQIELAENMSRAASADLNDNLRRDPLVPVSGDTVENLRRQARGLTTQRRKDREQTPQGGAVDKVGAADPDQLHRKPVVRTPTEKAQE